MKLNGRAKHHPSPTYVALGTMDRYYIKFANGKSEWVGCEDMSKTLQESTRAVRTVAFGEDWDSYFVVFDDGYWAYKNVPTGLCDQVKKRNSRADLAAVSLGLSILSVPASSFLPFSLSRLHPNIRLLSSVVPPCADAVPLCLR